MQQVEPIIAKLRISELDEYEPLKKYFPNPVLKLSHVAFGSLILSILCTFTGIAPRVVTGLVGALIPSLQAINKYQTTGEIYTCLPYFIIFSTYLTFQGWIMWIFSFIPCFDTMCLLFVLALYHPDVQLSNKIWALLQKVV
ncbi:unnamed protein product (macronuclear) [Paramecium tetraurelia]|uniref:Bicarbonate transporter-like transmembrane domain-containing protein n=1 Tax=Paramecium tetraurelia TaxID=5888 RepID=A0CES5_PARTE|nr:uncharacterized protein GSPATT00037731001 [Paramecium tetraurelia]CAK69292.1 unnamed protein product [Paramecium tetraurelia]|eukprot:XP_001436689.1 hypothetical protein (macronuclear) [Paramecium tetraurelia strain d4-2]